MSPSSFTRPLLAHSTVHPSLLFFFVVFPTLVCLADSFRFIPAYYIPSLPLLFPIIVPSSPANLLDICSSLSTPQSSAYSVLFRLHTSLPLFPCTSPVFFSLLFYSTPIRPCPLTPSFRVTVETSLFSFFWLPDVSPVSCLDQPFQFLSFLS